MKKLILTILLIALSVTVSDSRASALSPEEQVQWLIKTFGELPPEHHLTLEARKVFERVRATADKRADRDPRLLLIRAADEPWAICLKDGTIVLTEKSLEFCYKDADKAVGDSRTAFVMGHEMAHAFSVMPGFMKLETLSNIFSVSSIAFVILLISSVLFLPLSFDIMISELMSIFSNSVSFRIFLRVRYIP